MSGLFRRFACLAAVVALALPATAAFPASGAPPDGFRDKRWGTHSTAGLQPHAVASEKVVVYRRTAGQPLPPLLGVPVRDESYSYSNGRMFNGIAYFSGQDSLAKLKEALTRAYGPPDVVNEAQGIWRWKWPSRSIEVMLTRGSASFTQNAY